MLNLHFSPKRPVKVQGLKAHPAVFKKKQPFLINPLPALITRKMATLSGLALLFICNLHAQYPATTGSERLKSIARRSEMEAQSLLKNISFRNIGPTIMSGRVVAIDANPADPTEFYVAYASGGLWYTRNNGLSFAPVFDNNDNIFMGDVAVDWKTHTIWVGTGEVNSSRSSYAGTGVYKSRNNGKTWEYLGLPESEHIGKIVLHPSDSNTAWVAALGHLYSYNKERGVYKTTDGGKTWKQTLFVDDKTGAVDIEIDPIHPNILFASMWYRTRTAWNFEEAGKTSGLYKSVDGGETWTLLNKPGSGLPQGDGLGRMGLAVFPKNPQIVYAILDNQSKKENQKKDSVTDKLTIKDFKTLNKEQFALLDDNKVDTFLKNAHFPAQYNSKIIKEKVAAGIYKPSVIYDYLRGPNDDLFDASGIVGCEVYRSDDGGNRWKKMNEKELAGMYYTYGYYFGKIWVSPVNADKVYITGVPVMLSSDAGKTFTDIDGKNVHSDHHVVWIDPNKDGHIINGNDGGVNITYDDGKAWFKANSVPAGQYYSIEVDDAKPYNVYGGLQDNGVWYGPSAIGKKDDEEETGFFRNINGGDGMMVQVDTRDNATFYSGSQFGFYSRSSKNTDQRKFFRPQHLLGETPLRFNWETPILLSKHNQDVLYMGSNRFHRSLNKADTMINLSGDLTLGGRPGDVPYGTLTWIAESPLKFGLLYTGSDDGLIHISRDGGYTWSNISNPPNTTASKKKSINNGLPQNLWVNCITPSAYKEGRVYLALSGYRYDHFNAYIFVSEDYGNSWQALSGNLPLETVNSIKEDPKNENILYVGTDAGLYASIDRGQTYMPFTNGLPRVPVHDIAIQKRENEIVIGTHGRSIFIAKLDGVQQLASSNKGQDVKKTTGN